MNVSRRRLIVLVLAGGGAGVFGACSRVPEGRAPAARAPRPSRPIPSVADPPGVPLNVGFARTIHLEGVTLAHQTVRPGDELRLWLHWRASAVSQDDLRSLGQLVSAEGRVVAREDDQIGGRRYHLSKWSAGERRIDEMRIGIGPNTPTGEYILIVSVLRPDNQTTVPITDRPPRLALYAEDAVLVAPVEVSVVA